MFYNCTQLLNKRNCVYLPFKSKSLIIESKGLIILVKSDLATWVYISIVLLLECPNNSRSRDKNNLIRKVNGILRKKRSNLESHNPDGKGKISKEKLLKEGFDFSYYTNVYCTKAGKQYYFCYEQGYLPIENEYLALVIKKEYID